MDIGNPDLLHSLLGGTFMRGKATSDPIREFGYAVAVNRGPITTRAWRLMRGWNQEWQDLGRPELPVLQNGTRTQSGEQALRQLANRRSIRCQRAPRTLRAPVPSSVRAGGHRQPSARRQHGCHRWAIRGRERSGWAVEPVPWFTPEVYPRRAAADLGQWGDAAEGPGWGGFGSARHGCREHDNRVLERLHGVTLRRDDQQVTLATLPAGAARAQQDVPAENDDRRLAGAVVLRQ
jgi:hypothetical protein